MESEINGNEIGVMMEQVKKYAYQLRTISSVILSPREQEAFYLDKPLNSDRLKTDDIGLEWEKIKMIYPFYQYGTYQEYCPGDAQYYIPGSSIKGVISCGQMGNERNNGLFMADDVLLSNLDLRLNHLYKLQYLTENRKKIKLDVFFPNVAVEMLKADSICYGEIFYSGDMESLMDCAQIEAKRRIGCFMNQLKLITDKKNQLCGIEKEIFGNMECRLNQMIQQMDYKKKSGNLKSYLLLLGGYKGLALSGISNRNEVTGAFYIDQKKHLPHGLIELTLE